MLCKSYYVDSKCTITPGDRNLTKYPAAVIAVLNCTFNGRSVDTFSWTRNKQPVENNTLVDSAKRKKWSAAVLYTNSTSVQDADVFTCVAKSGKDAYSCSVRPSKKLSSWCSGIFRLYCALSSSFSALLTGAKPHMPMAHSGYLETGGYCSDPESATSCGGGGDTPTHNPPPRPRKKDLDCELSLLCSNICGEIKKTFLLVRWGFAFFHAKSSN